MRYLTNIVKYWIIFSKMYFNFMKIYVKYEKNIFLKIFIKTFYFYIIYERIQESNFNIKEYFKQIK